MQKFKEINIIRYKARISCITKQCKKKYKSKFSKVLSIRDHNSNLGEFDIIICDRCGLGYTNPFPTEQTSHLLYNEKNSNDFDIIKGSIIDYLKNFFSIRLLKKLGSGGGRSVKNVLDYSTGNGRYAWAASKVFPNALIHAVDYQETPPFLLLNNNPRIKYFKNTNFFTAKKYDLIFLRHVLEHTYDPAGLIQYLGKYLSDSGILYIEVPNLDSGCAKFFKKYSPSFYVPRHIFHFTGKSLASVIEEAGLNYEIGKIEMPMMGNTFAILTGYKAENLFVKIIGIFLHPFQLVLETFYNSSTCINAICFKRKNII